MFPEGSKFNQVLNSSDKNIQQQQHTAECVPAPSPVARWELRGGWHDQLVHAALCHPTGKGAQAKKMNGGKKIPLIRIMRARTSPRTRAPNAGEMAPRSK